MKRRPKHRARRRPGRSASAPRRPLARLHGESLEHRFVLSLTTVPDTEPITATQTAALIQGVDVLSQRLAQLQESSLLGQEAAALGESLGTLAPLGDRLRTNLAERLATLLPGAATVGDLRKAFTDADVADSALTIRDVDVAEETLDGHEAAAIADACHRAATITGDPTWLVGVDLAVGWFLGDNDTGVVMYDADSGGGFDGLRQVGRNENRGAESTLAALATLQLGHAVAQRPGRNR